MDDRTSSESNHHGAKRVLIEGSHRNVVPGATSVGQTDPNQQVSVTVVLRRRASDALEAHVERTSALPFGQRRHMTHDEFAAAHGADPADVEQVRQFAKQHALTVVSVNVAASTMVLSGRAASVNEAFAIDLNDYEHKDFTYRGRVGAIHIPDYLADIVTAVLGLDNRPQSAPHFRLLQEERESVRPLSAQVSYTPPEVAQLYNFPPNVNCDSQCVAIIELGGGYNIDNLNQYFTNLGVPLPHVVSVSVDGAGNQPTGDANGPDGEVDLDIEVVGSVAPGARIVVYFAPNTDAGFLNAVKAATHDAANKPSVISISWGGPENSWTIQAMQAMNRAFQDAAALGVTVCCAAGDNGSADGAADGAFHVDFPASAPYALACGGTSLFGSVGQITRETVWNDGPNGGATGGGVSDIFPLPAWQANANVPPSANPGGHVGRGVPDVAGDADPATGYQVLVDGNQFAIGGTSAVAPLWAGLVAIANQTLGNQVGFVNPILYRLSGQGDALRDVTQGNNDVNQTGQVYRAAPGWDACTGLGSPNGVNLINALHQAESADEAN